MNKTQVATKKINQAAQLLLSAKKDLQQARNDQLIPLSIVLEELKVVENVLLDPECTPETFQNETLFFDDGDHYDPDKDQCIWDDNRIESTKSLLFAEAIANGELR